MGFPEPPQDGKPSSWFAWAFIVLCLAIGWVAFNTLGGRIKGKKPEDADAALNLPTSGDAPDAQISTRGMTPEMAGSLAKVSVTLAEVVAMNADLDERVKKIEDTNRHLVEHVAILRKGIANGTIPPLPELSENIKHLFGDVL